MWQEEQERQKQPEEKELLKEQNFQNISIEVKQINGNLGKNLKLVTDIKRMQNRQQPCLNANLKRFVFLLGLAGGENLHIVTKAYAMSAE